MRQHDALIKKSIDFIVQARHPGIILHGRASVEVGLYVCLPKGEIIID